MRFLQFERRGVGATNAHINWGENAWEELLEEELLIFRVNKNL